MDHVYPGADKKILKQSSKYEIKRTDRLITLKGNRPLLAVTITMQHLVPSILGNSLKVSKLVFGRLFIVVIMLLGKKSYTVGKPGYFYDRGATFVRSIGLVVGLAAQLSMWVSPIQIGIKFQIFEMMSKTGISLCKTAIVDVPNDVPCRLHIHRLNVT